MAASLLACGTGGAAAPDAGPDAAPLVDARPAPAVSTVLVDGIATREVRQGSTSELTLQGQHLDLVRYVQVGALTAAVVARSETAVRATLAVPHGFAPGAVSLVVTADAVTTVPDVLTVTPVVVAEGGRDDGRGTFDAPLRLCAPLLPGMLGAGDTLQLEAGTHRCAGSVAIPPGVIVRGRGAAETIVRGDTDPFAGLVVAGAAGTTEVRDLTLIAGRDSAVQVTSGDVIIDGVVVADSAGRGLTLASGAAATVSGFTYRGGATLAILIDASTAVTASGLRIDGCAVGVGVNHGTLDASDVAIRGCHEGVVGTGDAGPLARRVEIRATGLDVAGTDIGVRLDGGLMILTDPVIDATGAAAPAIGVRHRGGDMTLTGGRVTGWPVAVELGFDVGIASLVVNASISGAELSGETAIRQTGNIVPTRVRVRQTRATGSLAAVLITGAAPDSTLDLGTAAEPGGNALTCERCVALDDTRAAVGAAIDMHGSTLNGLTFDASESLTGPATALPYYRIRVANALRF
jgi:hypothetical protein